MIDACLYCKDKLDDTKKHLRTCHSCNVHFLEHEICFFYYVEKLKHILRLEFMDNSFNNNSLCIFYYQCYDLKKHEYYWKYDTSCSIAYKMQDIMRNEDLTPQVFKKCIDKLPLILTFI